jgi:hypothetical protein
VSRKEPPAPNRLILMGLGLGVATVVALAVVVGFTRVSAPPLQCSPGLVPHNGACEPGSEPVDKYARCIIQDVKQHNSGSAEASIDAKLQVAKEGVDTVGGLKENFERTIEKSVNMCFLFDVSAKCFSLAGGKGPAAIPAQCQSLPAPAQSGTAP